VNAAWWINWLTNLVTLAAGGGIGLAIITKWLNRKVDAHEADRKKRDDERQDERDREDRDRRRRDSEDLLAESRSVAQRTALESANSALATVEKRCDNCEKKLGIVEAKCERLIVATEALVADYTDENRKLATSAVWAARHAI
jgi:hypothetical protein